MQPTCATYFNQNLALNAKNTSIFSQNEPPERQGTCVARHVPRGALGSGGVVGSIPCLDVMGVGGSGWGETAVFHVNHDFARYWVVGARYPPDAAVLVALARFLSHGYRIGREPRY